MDLYNELERLCGVVEDEIKRVNQKLDKAGGELSGDDISYIDKLTHTIKSIKTTMAMMDAEDGGYSRDGMIYGGTHNGRYGGTSYARGRSYAKRDSMGRYSRNRGYSRDGETEEIVEQLREIMQDTQDERTRQEFQKFIQKVESM